MMPFFEHKFDNKRLTTNNVGYRIYGLALHLNLSVQLRHKSFMKRWGLRQDHVNGMAQVCLRCSGHINERIGDLCEC